MPARKAAGGIATTGPRTQRRETRGIRPVVLIVHFKAPASTQLALNPAYVPPSKSTYNLGDEAAVGATGRDNYELTAARSVRSSGSRVSRRGREMPVLL